jgi:hypothetical protein
MEWYISTTIDEFSYHDTEIDLMTVIPKTNGGYPGVCDVSWDLRDEKD